MQTVDICDFFVFKY